jgi:hypothetical protein
MFQSLTRMVRHRLPRNQRINHAVISVSLDALRVLGGVEVVELDLKQREHERWITEYLPGHIFSSPLFKKPIEFFGTYKILEPKRDDVFLDAAGGVYTYLHRLPVREKIMQDLQIPAELKSALGGQVRFVESDAGDIPLPDSSIDKISCHHSFEHFEGDSDTRFIIEVQRLLRVGGRACILPLFISNRYFELTNRLKLTKKFDAASRRVIDLTATLPGGNSYARIYDPPALQRRVLDHIDQARFRVSIIQLSMDGRPVPDLTLPANQKVAAVNRPFRALVIDRLG